MSDEKIIIVEGGSDRKRLARILAEPVEIICTNGTVSPYRLEELLAPYEEQELYVFVDADEDGEKTRTLFKRAFPAAIHLYTEKVYREVETTPYKVLAAILLGADFKIRPEYLF
ncbi:toprim domain-containing protein [Sporosarcina sp. JAI121]|uniref:toprim domain-containing protein n=1 Tax=Sporosarcina sp. JAI121 TaxID=2723064 RepID=UPI0015C89832|nr:toprim domain-containing protein [Sporosarcina sp. JAI121]NYF26159.1 toprim domain protein [Sporosarcina sp. JAI121]